jgi:carboxylesterase
MPDAEPFSADGGPVGVLLIHGFTGNPSSMKDWGRSLADAGLAVEVPRLPGHGTKWQDSNATTWQDWYAEVERTFGLLQERCDKVFVMGLSMGGTLALRLAEQRGDEIAGVVLVNPAVHTEDKRLVLLPVLRRVLSSFPGISNDVKKEGVVEGAYDKLPLKAFYSLTQLWALVKADIGKVDQPLLVFRSADDHVVEPSNAAYVLEHVASADKAEVVLENSYHVATIDNDAETIFTGSLDFVRRVAPQQVG